MMSLYGVSVQISSGGKEAGRGTWYLVLVLCMYYVFGLISLSSGTGYHDAYLENAA